ncbi:hypothetical protein [Anaerotignum sp.]|uniref:hypothetical protein n=1 Tax=Anaerotignum sp. TaxID=2039241 RepID=UPI0028B1A1B6|nr:hypothetical protein [Anaerotignum sp.]
MGRLVKKQSENKETRFSKEAILRSQRYADHRDLLSVLLDNIKVYSQMEVEGCIEKFQKGEVK